MISPRDFPPGIVAVPMGDLTRYAHFWVSAMSTATPPHCVFSPQLGVNIANNLNRAIQQATFDWQWVWILGDDHEWRPDLLLQLLARQVDLVAPVVLKRTLPPTTVAYRIDPVELAVQSVPLQELPTSGLYPVDAVGGAGLLVQRRVFEAMPAPWFEFGRTQSDHTGEDMWFCEKARHLGFQCYIDCSQVMGHTTPVTLWPTVQDGRWTADVRFGSGAHFVVPPEDLADA
jgi:hypothetical protein